MTDPRRTLPPVNTLFEEAERAGLTAATPRRIVVNAIRATLAQARARGGHPPNAGWLSAVEQRLTEQSRRSLRRVVNATGVVLHTNLGRAPLAATARRAVDEA